FNNPVVALIGVDQERVVDDVRSDPDVLQDGWAAGAGTISFVELTEISSVCAALLRAAKSRTQARAEAAAWVRGGIAAVSAVAAIGGVTEGTTIAAARRSSGPRCDLIIGTVEQAAVGRCATEHVRQDPTHPLRIA